MCTIICSGSKNRRQCRTVYICCALNAIIPADLVPAPENALPYVGGLEADVLSGVPVLSRRGMTLRRARAEALTLVVFHDGRTLFSLQYSNFYLLAAASIRTRI